jgi:WD40 repeat protein
MLEANIYTVGGTVQAGRGFYLERQADHDLLQLCQRAEFAYILSARQMGKSSLMVRTAERLAAEGIRSVKLDLTLIGTQLEAESWYFGLLFEIKKQLRLKFDLVGWWQEHASLGLTQRLTLFFEEVLLVLLDSPLVIFVDEIDTTLTLDFTDDFFAAIRAFFTNRANNPAFSRLSFVLIGVATPGDLVRDPKRTPFNIGQRVEMTDFTFEEALPLASGLRLPQKEARQTLEWVLEWTGGHPYLTQRLCQALSARETLLWTREEVEEVVRATFFEEKSEQDNNLQFVRDMLTKRAPDLVGVLSTYREIRRARRPVPDEEQSLIKSHLKLSGVVYRERVGLKVRNLIYRTVFDERWIKEHLPINWAQRLRRASRLIAVMMLVTLMMTLLAVYALVQQNEATIQRNEAQAQAATAQVARQQALSAQQTAEARRIEAEQQRQLALSRELSANAISQGENNLELGLLLALQAEKVTHTDQSEAALRQLLLSSPLASIWRGPEGELANAAFSRDKTRVLLLAGDGTATVAEVATGKVISKLSGAGGAGSSAIFSPGGTKLVTADANGTAQLWDLQTNPATSVSVLQGHSASITSMSFSPDGTKLVTVSTDASVRIWDGVTGRPVATLIGHTGPVLVVQFSPDGTKLVTTGQDATARLWEAASGKEIALLDEHSSVVSSAAFSQDGKLLVTGSYDGTARLWDVATGKSLSLLAGHTNRIYQALFSPDGTKVLTASRDRTLRLWEVATGRVLDSIPSQQEELTQVEYSRDGKLVVGLGTDKFIRLWNVEAPPAKVLNLSGSTTPIDQLAFSPNGQQLITITHDQTVRVWEVNQQPGVKVLEGGLGQLTGAAFSPDGLRLVSVGSDGTVSQWETASGKSLPNLVRSCSCPINQLAFSPDGKILAIVTADGTIERWERQGNTFQPLPTLTGSEQNRPMRSIAFSRDGKLMVSTGDDKTARIWETASGQPLVTITSFAGSIASASFNPDGTQLMTAEADGAIRVWEVSSGKVLEAWVGHTKAVNSVMFSQDGAKLASAGQDGTVRIWAANSGKVLVTLKGPQGSVNSAVFSPDGKRILTAREDGISQLWDANSGQLLVTLGGHSGRVSSASFSPDGSQLVTSGGADRTLRLYRQEAFAPLSDLLELARHRVTRELSCDEQKQYVHVEVC